MSHPLFQIPDGLEHLLPMFQTEMQRDLQTLKSLLSASAEELADHLHAMRGKCGLFGEDVLFELLASFDSKDPGAHTRTLQKIERRIRLICDFQGPGG